MIAVLEKYVFLSGWAPTKETDIALFLAKEIVWGVEEQNGVHTDNTHHLLLQMLVAEIF